MQPSSRDYLAARGFDFVSGDLLATLERKVIPEAKLPLWLAREVDHRIEILVISAPTDLERCWQIILGCLAELGFAGQLIPLSDLEPGERRRWQSSDQAEASDWGSWQAVDHKLRVTRSEKGQTETARAAAYATTITARILFG